MANDTKPPEPEDLIRYDVLAQEALLSVVKKVLSEVARTGLPGDHHFYITFDTTAPGVRISTRMREKYPEEMTIVVQHQYWDLETTENGFSIGLSFDGIPESLLVPFSTIRGFFDPSVQFGLQFDSPASANDGPPAEISEIGQAKIGSLPSPAKSSVPDEKKDDKGDSADREKPDSGAEVVSLDAFRKK